MCIRDRINVGRTPYGITKGAVNLLTQQLGAEWALYNIKVNAIAPVSYTHLDVYKRQESRQSRGKNQDICKIYGTGNTAQTVNALDLSLIHI